MNPKCNLIPVMLLTLTLSASASQLAEVSLRDRGDLHALLGAGLDVVTVEQGEIAQVVLLDQNDRDELNRTGLRYSILRHDLESWLASRLEPLRDDMGGYMTLDELIERMNQLHEDFPDLVGEPVSIGRSIEDRDIWAFKVSDNPDDDEDEPEALYTALIHCREVITPEVLFHFIEHLLDNYGEDEYLTGLVDERELWFIPCVNPDGYAYNERTNPNGGGMWRKNRRDNGNGRYGVDLNRNFGYEWGFDDIGSSTNPDDQTFRGEEAFSEPETQAIRDFTEERNFTVSLFFHSYGNLLLYPLGYDFIQAQDRAPLMALAMKAVRTNGYIYGTGWEAIYITNGDSDDWLYAGEGHAAIFAMTPEVGNSNDYFWPPLNRVETLVNDNLELCIAFADYALNPYRSLNPPQPQGVSALFTDEPSHRITWETARDDDNPAVSYNVRAFLPGETVIDDSPADQTRWTLKNFSHSQVDQHSGALSYRVQTTMENAYLILNEDIPAPDTIWAWVHYNLRTDLDHYLALEACTDGYSWEALRGRNTRDLIMNDHNLGPGLTGASDGWERTWWVTDDYAGLQVKLRFRYWQFGIRRQNEMAFIDDISPFPGYEYLEVLAENVEDTVWYNELEYVEGFYYQVQAVDPEGDLSYWSLPVPLTLPPDSYTLSAPRGWSMVSIPLEPQDPALETIFSEWTESGSFNLLKNVAGDYWSPRHEIRDIENWDPLAGYQLHMLESDTVEILGRWLAPDTPIPLTQGWNIVAFLPLEPLTTEEAFESVLDNLVIAKNGWGRFIVPDYPFDNMEWLRPGEGYQLYAEQADTLVYPSPGRIMAQERDGNTALESKIPLFNPAWSPDNHSLLLKLDDNTRAGRITLLDYEGYLCGECEVASGMDLVGIAAWGESSPGEAGFAAGETMGIFWTGAGGDESDPMPVEVAQGSLEFAANGFTVLQVRSEALTVSELILHPVQPNPFNSFTRIRYSLPFAGMVRLSIIDATGRTIETLEPESRSAGIHSLVWDAATRPSGIYFARLESASPQGGIRTAHTKLLLVR